MILGLTGGIASGKSTVSRILTSMGVEVVDADVVAREVSERQEVVEKLIAAFGGEILCKGSEGVKRIDRKKLREIVFYRARVLTKPKVWIGSRKLENL